MFQGQIQVDVCEGDEMNKLTVNEDLILSELGTRLAVAEQVERDAAAELRLASAIVAVHRANLEAAEKLLTPKQRKGAEEAPVSSAAPKEPTGGKELKCGICYHVKDHPDHDRTYLKSHDFEPPKSVARAPRKSKPKSEATSSTQSLDVVTDVAIGAGASAGD